MKKNATSDPMSPPSLDTSPASVEASESLETQVNQGELGIDLNLDSDEELVKALKDARSSQPTREESFPIDETFLREVETRANQYSSGSTWKDDKAPNQPGFTPEPSPSELPFEPAIDDGEIGRLGNYKIIRMLGQGGMGLVFEALDGNLHRKVAIKVMHSSLSSSEQHRARFLREAQLAAKVESDFVCPIFQVGEVTSTPFIAMPYLNGTTLEAKMSGKPMRLVEALHIATQIAKGLAAAHALGLTHRDIKPSNIFLESRADHSERVRILDFGLARVEENDLKLTCEGTILGTPAYMSPEQARGEALDRRSDLFSLGVVVYEMMTGCRPFRGNTSTSLIASLLVDQPIPPHDLQRGIPEGLSQFMMQLLQKSPEDRSQSAAEVVGQFEQWHQRLMLDETAERLPTQGIPQPQVAMAPKGSAVPRTLAKCGKGRWPNVPVLVGLLIVSGFFLVWGGLFLFSTPNGTLVIEADDESDLRLRKGEIQIFDEHGKLAYKLAPSEKSKGIASGSYMVRVEGADGVQLDTPKFEMKKNGRVVVRATAVEPGQAVADKGAQEASKLSADASIASGSSEVGSFAFGPKYFPGRITIGQLKPEIGTNLEVVPIDASNPQAPSVMLYREKARSGGVMTTKLPINLNSAAFAMRVSLENARPIVNMRIRHRDNHVRWLSAVFLNGAHRFVVQDHQFRENRWNVLPYQEIATLNIGSVIDKNRNQLDICGRWSETDYDLWIDGVHVIGGEIEKGDLFRGNAGPLELGMMAIEEGPMKMIWKELWVWDQSALSVEQSQSTRLPGRGTIDHRIR